MPAKPAAAPKTDTSPPREWPALMSAETVAAYFDCSVRWVWKAAAADTIPKPIKVGSLTRWRKSDLDAAQ